MKRILTFSRLSVFLLLCSSLLFACSKKSWTLPAPETVTASNNFAVKVLISWSQVEGAIGFDIFRAPVDASGNTGEYIKIERTELNSYVDYGVISSSKYTYKVQPVGGTMSEPFFGETTVIKADQAFDALAELTNGKRDNADDINEVVSSIIDVISDNAMPNSDLVLLISNTSSMGDAVSEIKSSLNNIISTLPAGTRLAVATYHDANVETNWFKYVPFTTNYADAETFINNISVLSSGDQPESVYDGIYESLDKLSWTSTSKRTIIIIGDAPPLEGNLSSHTLLDVVNKTRSMTPPVNLYPILIK